MATKKARRSERAKETWNKISGIMSVYGNTFKSGKKEFTKWSATVGKKNDSGEYENYYLTVRFVGEAEEPETDGLHQIDVENAFFSIETWPDKETGERMMRPVLIVTACETVD